MPLFKEPKDEEVEFFRAKFAGSQADRAIKAEAEANKIAEQMKNSKALLRYCSQDRSTGKIRPSTGKIRPGPREGRGGRSLKAHSSEGPRCCKQFIYFYIVYLIHTSAYHTIKCL
ncbi:putative methionine--tRNA ligase [Helianthus annuus]|uniref:Methionine--tRNA ligase n=1 Tax=Helianthus annuus TaxID=4232 RepID=A0A251TV06_HELAN|nr:putative methionine--tRNA ligase [Helianthus annuus]KAJ0525276.1 putative methionine--tRNA ligase [Helianthus annuus]KAJ0533339.1 putative methionine--tRNA ligase [Helianthus annuus]KAJ0541652.1 putative methionine--tRNA ligase [Helianthus annuus]KAJ0706727.1 putative methionine--tRNA ligase [Helianthus annuus]